jgi:ssDNA-binding replication factor A large subunit
MSDSELYSSDESCFEESDDKQIVKFRKANVNDVNISDAVLASFGQHLKVILRTRNCVIFRATEKRSNPLKFRIFETLLRIIIFITSYNYYYYYYPNLRL